MLPYEIFSTLDGSLTVNLSSGECHDAMSLLCSQNVEFGKADPIFNKTPSLSNSYLLRLKCKARNLQLILCPTTTMQKDLYSPICFMPYRIPQYVGLSERFFRVIVNRSKVYPPLAGLSAVILVRRLSCPPSLWRSGAVADWRARPPSLWRSGGLARRFCGGLAC